MARTVTIDGSQLQEVRVSLNSLGQLTVQASFVLTSGGNVFQQVFLQDLTNQLQANETSAASTLYSLIGGAVQRVELATASV
jgi:hypothetical protein